MAEYIDRTQLEPDTEWSDYDDGFISYSQSQINSLPTADVVERFEYEKLRLVNLDCARTNEGLLGEHKQLIKLRSKINKAIEEIKEDMIAHSGTGEEVIQAYCDGLKKALEYLENIGEE